MQFYHLRRETTHYFRTGFIFALLLLSNVRMLAYSVPEIVEKTKPAVVEIVAIDQKGSTNRLGTGFFISPDGQAVTNRHVIEGASSIAAVGNNGAIFLFERVFAQPTGVDLAILKFRATDVPFLTLGKSTTAVEGEKVIVIGNPTGLTGTVSDGIISAFREKRSLLQITAPISPGSSGSPVMDENAEVIGVATLQIVEGQNLNFAVAVEEVSAALNQLLPEQSSAPALSAATATPTPALDAKVYYDSGLASLDKLDYPKAISDFTEAIRLDPNFARAYNNRGITYENQRNFDKAVSDYNEAIRLDPNFALAYYNRGNAYHSHGNLDKAISDYDEAIRLDPNYASAYVGRGLTYDQHGNLDKAISDYNEAIRLDPHLALAYYNRGNAYHGHGNLGMAISDYSNAIRLDPNYALPSAIEVLRTATRATTKKRSAILARQSGSTQTMPLLTRIAESPTSAPLTGPKLTPTLQQRSGSTPINRGALFAPISPRFAGDYPKKMVGKTGSQARIGG